MRVLFVSINKLRSYRPVLPLGMVAVATQARAAGHEVRCLDLMFEEDDEVAVTRQVAEFGPEVVGISIRNVDSLNLLEPAVYTPIALEIAEWARAARPGVRIVLGGAGFTTVPEDLMDFVGADFGLTGFAEESVVELLRCLQAGVAPREVPGVIYPLPGGGYHRRRPAFTLGFDALTGPDPAFYDPRYRSYAYETHDTRQRVPASVQTKKGCALRCVFCSNFLVDGDGVKTSPVGRVVDEIERLAADGFGSYEIVDGVFNLPLRYALRILREMARRRLTLPWSCMVNPGAVTAELVDLMARTGCRQVEMGTNSCHDRVLDTLRSGFRRRHIVAAHQRFRDAGIRVMHCLFLGSPGDDADTVRATFDTVAELVPPGSPTARAYWTFGLRICRGTELYEIAVRERVIRGDERFLVPKYYVSGAVREDPALLDEIQQRVLANGNWYLWWGLGNISLRERIRLAGAEHRAVEQMLLRHLERTTTSAASAGAAAAAPGEVSRR